MKKIILVCIFILPLYSSPYSDGKNLYYAKGCANCHGTQAEGSGNFPKLANKKQKYLLQKLKSFQNGKSNTQMGQMMFSFAKSLNKKELKSITIYLSQHKEDNSDKYRVSEDILGSVD